ncbi:LysR family transcriptional regulator [Bordetella genomosp. 9]|uniref:Transcriptional regulator n=1 Tax=Bordetella genomosp. 9 TaxID=1416803 RepID=A0A1W6YV69_9BORD|nr:LysR family transcriptional regulator [Bordetella genomosp. 9]ARP84789.1 transcriptional regulator [Bordetella genomosp. 9]
MDLLECMEVFQEVGKSLSFSKAAESRASSRSSVTKKIAWLEGYFGVQLFNRNTKHVSLTESGRLLLENADALALATRNLKELVQGPVRNPSGRIRMGTPPSFGAVHLAPAIENFLNRYPAIRVSLLLDDGRSDLIAENLDLSVRIAPRLKDTNQIAYRITVVPQVIVATRAYLKAHGAPKTPKDLENHNCLIHSLKAPTGMWVFTDKRNNTQVVQVSGTFNSNLGESILHLAKLGHGISMHPRYMVENDLRAGVLEVLMPEYRPEGLDIYAIVQSKRHLPYKVRLFVDHLRKWFKDAEWQQ